MVYQICKPISQLERFIQFFWILEQDSRLLNCQPQRIIANGCVEIILHFGDRIQNIRQNQTSDYQSRTLISGHLTEYFDVVQTGMTRFLCILFKPHALRLFFDLPANELTNQQVDLELIKGSYSYQLLDQIANAASNEDRIKIVETYLLKRLTESNIYNFERMSAVIDLVNTGTGNISVKEMAGKACLSDKQFYRIFSEQVGLSPKQFLRTIRLQQIFYLVQRNPQIELSELVYRCGYYDQAHFNNDFKLQTGMSPATCFAKCNTSSDYFTSL